MPTHTAQQTFTVQEAAARTGLSEHTLRYYERAGLLAPVGREASSRHRRYTEDDLRAVGFLRRMRATGMPIGELQHYVRLYRAGDDTLRERISLLVAHRERVCSHIAELQTHLQVIEFKINNYERLGAESNWTEDRCLEIQEGSNT